MDSALKQVHEIKHKFTKSDGKGSFKKTLLCNSINLTFYSFSFMFSFVFCMLSFCVILFVMLTKCRINKDIYYILSRSSTRSLRSSSAPLLHVPLRRTSFGKRSFSTAAPSVWNSLPVSVQNCDTLTLFKSRLKAHLLSSVYAS